MNNTARLTKKETAVRIIPLMVLALLFLIAGIALFHDLCTGTSVMTVIIQAVVAGFGEELIFRLIILGLCFKLLKESRHFPAVIIVSILFGLAHFSNLMGGKFEFGMVLMQVVGAGIGGLIFGLMYYHTRSYLLCALVHFFYDLGVFFLSIGVGTLTLAGAADLVSEILIMVLCAMIAASYINISKKYLRIELILGIILAVLITLLKVIAYTNLNDRLWDSPVVHDQIISEVY